MKTRHKILLVVLLLVGVLVLGVVVYVLAQA